MPELTPEILGKTCVHLLQKNLHLSAELMALRQAVLELGVNVSSKSREELSDTLDAAEKYWHQFFLEKLEDKMPWFASMMDDRGIKDIWDSPSEGQPPTGK